MTKNVAKEDLEYFQDEEFGHARARDFLDEAEPEDFLRLVNDSKLVLKHNADLRREVVTMSDRNITLQNTIAALRAGNEHYIAKERNALSNYTEVVRTIYSRLEELQKSFESALRPPQNIQGLFGLNPTASKYDCPEPAITFDEAARAWRLEKNKYSNEHEFDCADATEAVLAREFIRQMPVGVVSLVRVENGQLDRVNTSLPYHILFDELLEQNPLLLVTFNTQKQLIFNCRNEAALKQLKKTLVPIAKVPLNEEEKAQAKVLSQTIQKHVQELLARPTQLSCGYVKKCECGSGTAGLPTHSSWCPANGGAV